MRDKEGYRGLHIYFKTEVILFPLGIANLNNEDIQSNIENHENLNAILSKNSKNHFGPIFSVKNQWNQNHD